MRFLILLILGVVVLGGGALAMLAFAPSPPTREVERILPSDRFPR